eukprot:363244-Pelagomonas_calceolata.AAC.1
MMPPTCRWAKLQVQKLKCFHRFLFVKAKPIPGCNAQANILHLLSLLQTMPARAGGAFMGEDEDPFNSTWYVGFSWHQSAAHVYPTGFDDMPELSEVPCI